MSYVRFVVIHARNLNYESTDVHVRYLSVMNAYFIGQNNRFRINSSAINSLGNVHLKTMTINKWQSINARIWKSQQLYKISTEHYNVKIK